jgi:hypothetical protein
MILHHVLSEIAKLLFQPWSDAFLSSHSHMLSVSSVEMFSSHYISLTIQRMGTIIAS